MGVRRKRIKPEQPQTTLGELGRLTIDTESALTTARGREVLALSEKHGLTVYDAAYLELARRYQLPLGTLDGDLRKAAPSRGRSAAVRPNENLRGCCITEDKCLKEGWLSLRE